MTLQDGLTEWGTLTDTLDAISEDGHNLKADIMDAKEHLAQLETRYAENDKLAQEASDVLGNYYARLDDQAKALGYKGAQDAQDKTGGCTFQ